MYCIKAQGKEWQEKETRYEKKRRIYMSSVYACLGKEHLQGNKVKRNKDQRNRRTRNLIGILERDLISLMLKLETHFRYPLRRS
jgi:hypothetical protein